MKRLSVLIPIYNVEKYLKECLDSIMRYRGDDIEIICINDGSTDTSLQIIKSYCDKDKRFVLIDKANSGYGDSLNQGLARAKGEFITFLESDDTINPDVLEKMLSIAQRENLDVIKANYNLLFDDRIEYFSNYRDVKYDSIFKPTDYLDVFMSAPAIWSGIYKKSLLNNNGILFLDTPGASYQDTSFMFKIWSKAESTLILNDAVINYRQTNENSSSNSNKKIFDILSETIEMKSYIMLNEMKEMLPLCARTKWQSFAWTLNRLADNVDKFLFLQKIREDIVDDFYEGNLDRKYWDDDNWNIVFNIVAFFDKIINDLGLEVNYRDLNESAKKHELGGRLESVDESFDGSEINTNKLYIIDSKKDFYAEIIEKFLMNKKLNFLVV